MKLYKYIEANVEGHMLIISGFNDSYYSAEVWESNWEFLYPYLVKSVYVNSEKENYYLTPGYSVKWRIIKNDAKESRMNAALNSLRK